MIVYCVSGDPSDGLEEGLDYHFSNKKDAVKKAKGMKWGRVTRINLGKVDKEQILNILNGRGYALSQDTIWQDGEWDRVKGKVA